MQKVLRLTISVGISFGVLALLLHLVAGGMDQAARPRMLEILFNTSLGLVGIYLLLHLLQLLVRAWRYQILITASGEQNVPSFLHVVLVTGVRNMLVDMLPARLGELSYIAMLNRGYRVSSQACVSSLAISIAFDFAALFVVIFAIVIKQILSTGFESWLLGALLSVIALVLIAMGSLFFVLPKITHWIDNSLTPKRRNKLVDGGILFLHQLSSAMETTRRSGMLAIVLVLSIIIRGLKYGGIYLLFRAVAEPSFPLIASAAPEKIIGALIGAEIGASLPIPAFMSFGTYEAGGTLMSSLLGLNQREALFSLLGVHIWSQVIDYSLGGLCLIAFTLMIRPDNRKSLPLRNRAWHWAGLAFACLVLASGTALLAREYRTSKKMGAVISPKSGTSVIQHNSKSVTRTRQYLADQGVSGFMVWSSNRDGNHDIFRMSLPDLEISRVTWHPHTEYYPRISPDGKQLVFARSQQPWVSQRNIVAWDVYWMDLETGEEKKLAAHATYPSWVNNHTVMFQQNAVQAATIDLSTSQHQIIYESGAGNPMPPGANIQTPALNPLTHQLIFTGRQSEIGMHTGFWGTAILDRDSRLTGILDGCEISWSRDGSYLYQVGHGGKKKTRFFRIDPATLKAVPWLDLPGEYSHEYFPKDSNDGRYLVFGASKGGHEHDSADYEMFLWHIGAPPEQVVRLTFHTGNDNWPDIFLNQ